MSKKSLLLVIIQFTIFAYFIFSGEVIAKKYWLIVQVFGFSISLWGILIMKIENFNIQPEVKPTAVFKTNGAYKIIRNPMYTGLILFFGASLISNYSPLHLSAFTLLVIVLLGKISLEEDFLFKKFGNEYLKYKKKTYRLIPFIY